MRDNDRIGPDLDMGLRTPGFTMLPIFCSLAEAGSLAAKLDLIAAGS
jgi:hypothetical protein